MARFEVKDMQTHRYSIYKTTFTHLTFKLRYQPSKLTEWVAFDKIENLGPVRTHLIHLRASNSKKAIFFAKKYKEIWDLYEEIGTTENRHIANTIQEIKN